MEAWTQERRPLRISDEEGKPACEEFGSSSENAGHQKHNRVELSRVEQSAQDS